MSKLNRAKENLSQAFADLETVILDKISQAKVNQDINLTGSELEWNNQEVINNFHNEINFLQESLAELGIENEKLRSFQLRAGAVVSQVKIDLARIKQIINSN